MERFQLSEAEKLHEIGEKIPTYAVAFEEKVRATSRNYLTSLWEFKKQQQRREKKKEYGQSPLQFGVDLVLPGILAGYDIEKSQTGDDSSAVRYLKEHNMLTKYDILDALALIEYMDYGHLLEYLKFFTKYPIDPSINYGDYLARDSTKKNGKRMDGTPLPLYPPLPKIQPFLRAKVPKYHDDKDRNNQSDDSKKGPKIF